MSNEQDIFQGLKDTMKEQIKNAYVEGAKQGSIITCTLLYNVLQKMGLDTTNIIYDFLRDIAKKNGCDNLDEEALKSFSEEEMKS